MNEKDKAVWYAAVDEWMTSSAGQDLGKFMFEKALAHRDEQVKGLVEALEFVKDGIRPGTEKRLKVDAALANYKEQTK